MKKNVMIRIDAELVEKAKELGLNISKVCENALNQAINALEQIFEENKVGNLGTMDSWWCSGRDLNPRLQPRFRFEPGSPARKAGILVPAILPEHHLNRRICLFLI